ncbi:hypothetical protein KKG71_07220 [Patescibacteria group bacterium]|nr:hypothetical protein [Patescibacteria group bacterium]
MQAKLFLPKTGAPAKCERKPSERCERSEHLSDELSSILWGEEESRNDLKKFNSSLGDASKAIATKNRGPRKMRAEAIRTL